MPATITLSDLTTAIRERCDQVNSVFRSDSSIYRKITVSVRCLHALILQETGHDRLYDLATFSTVAGTQSYALDADHFTTLGVDCYSDGRWRSLKAYQLGDRNLFAEQGRPQYYRLLSGNLHLIPIPDAVYSIRHHQRIIPAIMGSAPDTMDGIMGFEEWVICDVAHALALEEESFALADRLAQDRARIEANIRALAGKRNEDGTDRAWDATGWPIVDEAVDFIQ